MTIPHGYCIACGYALQGQTTGPAGYRCPECGRAFDPADSKSFRLTARHPLTRWLLKPIGWPIVLLSLVAAGGVLSVSRWTFHVYAPSTIDLKFFLSPSALRHRTSLVTWRDYVFTISMLLAIATAAWWLMRLIAGIFVRAFAESKEDEKPIHSGRRHLLISIALIVTIFSAALGWPYRLAQQWTVNCLASIGPVSGNNSLVPVLTVQSPSNVAPPISLSGDQLQLTLRAAVIQMPRADQRMAGLKLLVEDNQILTLPILTEVVSLESDSGIRALELRMIGICRDPGTIDLLMQFMDHPDADARAAAADAMGILHAPAFGIPLGVPNNWSESPLTTGKVPIDLSSLVYFGLGGRGSHLTITPLGKNVRDKLEQMMLTGPSTQEREAAARALLNWPPESYKLRVAEWGVWINDNGQAKLVQSVLDEIPPFVHRTGNPLSEFKDRITQAMFIDKPVVHITVDQPMAVDLSVVIDRGRPWFAYPNPDDFAVQAESMMDFNNSNSVPPKFLAALDNPAIETLPDVREGYPWLTPHHNVSGSINGQFGKVNDISGLGLRWQSLIVSPTKLPWMTLPDVGPDPKYAWWTRLREVPSGWVSSRGETERFLYYDGPTFSATNLVALFKENELQLIYGNAQPPAETAAPSTPPAAILLHHRNGQLTGQTIPMPPRREQHNHIFEIKLSEDDLHGNQAIDKFHMLTEAGLTTQEAEGLIAAWQPQFFQTDGTRLLYIMSRADYDNFCPLEIRPTPTETARVGIVLTELK